MLRRLDNVRESDRSSLLSVSDCAELIGISVAKAYEWLNAGLIPCQRNGRRFVIHRAEVEAWLEHGRAQLQPERRPVSTVDLASLLLSGEVELVINVRRRDDPS